MISSINLWLCSKCVKALQSILIQGQKFKLSLVSCSQLLTFQLLSFANTIKISYQSSLFDIHELYKHNLIAKCVN